MPLPWVRLDSQFPTNPKVVALLKEKDGYRAAFVYLCGLAHCGAHGTDGFIQRDMLPYIHARLSDAQRLARHGFWEEQPGGWLVHDWTQFQPTNEEMQQRRIRAQKMARARWDKRNEPTDAS